MWFFFKTDVSATRLKVGIKDLGNFLIQQWIDKSFLWVAHAGKN